MDAESLEEAKAKAGCSGWLSPREYATVAGVGEGHARTGIRERTIEFIRVTHKGQTRVFISPAEVLKRHLSDLISPSKRAATIDRLRDNAKAARVDFDFESIERNIELLFSAMNAKPVMEQRRGAAPDTTPVTERELVEVGAD